MAENMFAWLSIVVKQIENVIKPREILKCSWTDTFGSVLLKYGSDFQSERISHVPIIIFFFLSCIVILIYSASEIFFSSYHAHLEGKK